VSATEPPVIETQEVAFLQVMEQPPAQTRPQSQMPPTVRAPPGCSSPPAPPVPRAHRDGSSAASSRAYRRHCARRPGRDRAQKATLSRDALGRIAGCLWQAGDDNPCACARLAVSGCASSPRPVTAMNPAASRQPWVHGCSPEPARVGVAGWEAVRLSWVRGSHGPLSPAGLASTVDWVSCGGLGSSFARLLPEETARVARRCPACPGVASPLKVIDGCWRAEL